MMAGAEYLTEEVLLALWDEMARAFAASLAAARTGLQSFLTCPEPGLEPGRPGAFQSGGKPPRPRAALRLHGDLHDAALRPGEGTARAAGSGAARIRRGGQQGQAAVAAAAGAARRGTLRLAEADDRCRGDFPSAALGTARGVALPAQRARTGKRRRRGAHAGGLARQPSGAAPGDGDGRQPERPPPLGLDGLLDFQMGVTLDGEPLTEAEVATLLAGTDDLVLLRGQWVEVDRARLRTHDGAVSRGRGTRRPGRPELRRGDADAGRRRPSPATTRPRPTPTGRA